MPAMDSVVSADGTTIAYERIGTGPVVVVVPGAPGQHQAWQPVAGHLSGQFSCWVMDRRGTGASGDAPEYAPEREVDDILAVLAAAGAARLLGHSSGAVLALMVAARLPGLDHLVLYEPPIVAGTPLYNPELPARLQRLLAAGEREAALEAFLLEREPEPNLAEIAAMKASPAWPLAVSVAHTLPYHVQIVMNYSPDPGSLGTLDTPTLLVLGGDSPAYMREGTERLAAALPNATVATLPGHGHRAQITAPRLLADTIAPFLQRRT